MAKLGDICTLINGYAFKPGDWADEGLPIIRIQNLNDKNAPFNYYNGTIDEKYIVNDHDLLFAWSGTPGTSFGAFFWNRGKGILNQHIFNVFPVDSVNKNYFRYALNGNLAKIISKAHGGVGLQHITKKELEAIEIPVFPLKEQLHIAATLDSVTRVIDLCNAFLERLDLLVKARFVEMFGDPQTNNQSLPIKRLEELGAWNSGGTPSRSNPNFFKGNINWYSAGELNSLFLHGSNERITEEAITESAAKLFKAGSMLVGMYDTAAFKMGILLEDSASNQACACIEPNETVDIVWLYYSLTLMKDSFLSQRRGVRQKNLNLGMIKAFELPIADKEKQLLFVKIVEQIDQTKSAVKKVLEKAETLKKALMQEYFGP